MSAPVLAIADQECASLTPRHATSAARGPVLDASVWFIEQEKKSQVYFGKAEIHDILSKIHEATSQTHRRGWRSHSDALEIRRLHLQLVEVGWRYLRCPDGLGRK